MFTVGLTGNVAAGKSTVLALFASWGATVIDSDLLAREVVAPGTEGLAAVTGRFGRDLLRGDGTLDRAALRRRVMGVERERLALNAIVHPLVQRRADERRRAAEAAGDLIVVVDVPLLFEVRDPGDFDRIVLVDAPEPERRARLMRARGLGAAEADAVLAAQQPSAGKRARSHAVIDNDGPPDALPGRALAAWQRLRAEAARRALGTAEPRSLLAVFAHPDDETFGPGAALARYADAGLAVHLVCATGGEAARNRAGIEDPAALRRHRQGELRAAALVLGAGSLELLDFVDRTLAADDTRGAARVAGAIRRTRPDAIVTFGPDGVSGHPDHQAVHHWTRRAWEGEGRPCPLWYAAFSEEVARLLPERRFVGQSGAELAAELDDRPWLDVKEAAIRCHASQRYPLPLDTPAWRDRAAREVFGREGFTPGSTPPARDLFFA